MRGWRGVSEKYLLRCGSLVRRTTVASGGLPLTPEVAAVPPDGECLEGAIPLLPCLLSVHIIGREYPTRVLPRLYLSPFMS